MLVCVQHTWVNWVQIKPKNRGNYEEHMQTDQHLYTLTRSEFAKEIGKSREAVKQDMRRGKYKQLYIFVDGNINSRLERQCVKTRGQYPLKCTHPTKEK